MNKSHRRGSGQARVESGAPTKPALRLLRALAGDVRGSVDPADAGVLVLRGVRRGVSLGVGRHSREAADEVVRAGLAAWTSRPSGAELAITADGSAHLRRTAFGEPQEGFRRQHADWVQAEIDGPNGPERAVVNMAENPLDWLSRRKDGDGRPLIDPAAREAGERLQRDLTQGGILPSVSARWDGGAGGGGIRDPAAAADATIAARQRVRRALDAVGPDFANLLIDLCGFAKGLEEIERERRWPARSAKVVIRLALWRLADHYGLQVEARGPDGPVRFRVWQAESGLAPRGSAAIA